MTDEYKEFQKNIQNITSQQFTASYSLVGKIVDYTSNMQFCDIEVQMNGGIHTFTNVPAHGYPVKGSTGIIHFHNGNLEQPVCDCAYRLNPPEETLREYATDSAYNYHDNGNFIFDLEGYTVGPTKDSVTLTEEGFTSEGKSCTLNEYESYIEFTVDISRSRSKYIKFQCNYRGLGVLKIECFNAETNEIIQTAPRDIAKTCKYWNSDMGRFGWVYNKETYFRVNEDGTENKKIKLKITNVSRDLIPQYYGEVETQVTPVMSLDGILVYDENGGRKFFNSENDSLKLYNLITK